MGLNLASIAAVCECRSDLVASFLGIIKELIVSVLIFQFLSNERTNFSCVSVNIVGLIEIHKFPSFGTKF